MRDDRKRPDFRHHAHGTDRAGRGDDVDRIADKDAETQRQLLAQNDAGFFVSTARTGRVVDRWLLHLDRSAFRDRLSCPVERFLASSVTVPSRSGSMPRSTIPCTPLWVVSKTCFRTNGVAATTPGTVCDLFGDRIVVAHAVLHPVLHDDMGRRPKNLGLNVLLESGHDADRADQGRDAEGDAGDGDDGVQ